MFLRFLFLLLKTIFFSFVLAMIVTRDDCAGKLNFIASLITGIPGLIVLCFVVLHGYSVLVFFFFFFSFCKLKSVATLCRASLLVPFSPQHFLTSCFCVSFW